MKKIFSIIIVCSFLLSLTACGGTNQAKNEQVREEVISAISENLDYPTNPLSSITVKRTILTNDVTEKIVIEQYSKASPVNNIKTTYYKDGVPSFYENIYTYAMVHEDKFYIIKATEKTTAGNIIPIKKVSAIFEADSLDGIQSYFEQNILSEKFDYYSDKGVQKEAKEDIDFYKDNTPELKNIDKGFTVSNIVSAKDKETTYSIIVKDFYISNKTEIIKKGDDETKIVTDIVFGDLENASVDLYDGWTVVE